jgi:hypothetical protein
MYENVFNKVNYNKAKKKGLKLLFEKKGKTTKLSISLACITSQKEVSIPSELLKFKYVRTRSKQRINMVSDNNNVDRKREDGGRKMMLR